MKIKKRIVALLLMATMPFSMMGCGTVNSDGKNVRVIRVALGQNEDHPQYKALVEFEKYVEEQTNGELDVQIFPNELLGATAQAVELCQTGAVDLVVAGLGTLEAFEDSYTVFNLPYIMDSREHYHEVMNDESIMGPIYESTRKSGFIGLTWFDAGVRNIYTTKKPINTPDDLKGLKIRVQASPTNVKMLQALGASPTPMSFGEVYTGLQQSVIDGAENNELALINNKHGEVAKHYSYNMHAMLPDLLIVNASLLDKLTDTQAQAIIDGAKYANEFEVAAWDQATEEAKQKAEEMGVNFYYPDIKPFQEKMADLHNEYTQDPEAKAIFDQIRQKGDEILARNLEQASNASDRVAAN
jgi:tripartite ATP-independent transporter DctP family solute receptor